MREKYLSYAGLIFVVFVWGAGPLVTLFLHRHYSPSFRIFLSEVVLVVAYLIMAGKRRKEFNMEYIRVGVPTGIFLALANISQKIGLLYTTPARYAFLENLSCIVVPVLMYLLVKKKPGIKTVVACGICLLSVFVLNGGSLSGGSSWGMGELLCALAGILYGFNIAGTGVFAKKLYAPLYLAVQAAVAIVVSFVFALARHLITVPSAEGVRVPMEKIVCSLRPEHLIFLVVYTLISAALCWTIRTNAMKHVDPSAVSVIMPFGAVVTGVLSVLLGNDTLNLNLVLGGILGISAVILSGLDDMKKKTPCKAE